MSFRLTLIAMLGLLLPLLGACSKYMPKLDEVLPDKRTEYRKSKTMPDLEVPPDLTTDAIRDRMAIPEGGDVATYSTYQERLADQRKEKELAQAGEAALQKLENEYLLAVSGAPGLVWPQLRTFWQENGYTLELDDPELGVMETAWLENSEALTRDKFKIFSEPGEDPTTTLLYISHLGEELVPEGEQLVWSPRVRDEALEERVVGSLRTAFSSEQSAPPATAPDRVAAAPAASSQPRTVGGGERAEIVSAGDGRLYLAVQSAYTEAWRLTSRALRDAGVEVEAEDIDRGIFQVRFVEQTASSAKKKGGMLSKLAFWKGGDVEHEYRLSLTGVGEKTEVVVLDAEGRWDTSDAASSLLAALHQRLNEGA